MNSVLKKQESTVAGMKNSAHWAVLVTKAPTGARQCLGGARAALTICTHNKNIFYCGFQQVLLNDSVSVPLWTYILATEKPVMTILHFTVPKECA